MPVSDRTLFDTLYGNGFNGGDQYGPGINTAQPVNPRANGAPASRSNGENSAGQNWTDFSSALASFSQGEKANRIVKGNYTQDFDQMNLNREGAINALMSGRDLDMNKLQLLAQEDRRANEEDAMRKLQQTSYIMGGGSDFKPTTISLGGKQVTLPSFSGIAPHAPSEADKAGAGTLQAQMLDRLKPTGSFTPKYDYTPTWDYKVHPLEGYTSPGTLEKLGSYGGVAAGALGLANTLTGGKAGSYLGGLLGKIPGVGKFLGGSSSSAAGGGVGPASTGASSVGMNGIARFGGGGLAAAHGGYELIKGGGTGHNVLSGAESGAGVGTMILPGVGTAVGAGVGALTGLFRNGFRGSKTETEGRSVGAQGVSSLGSSATPAQTAEAGSNPDALAHVIMRDHLTAAGNPNADALAGQMLASIKEAERKGPEAVQAALANIAKTFGV